MEGYNFVLWFFFLLFFSFFPPPVSREDHTWSSRLEMFIFKVKRGERKKKHGTFTCTKPKNLKRKKRSISGGGNSNWDNKQRRADEHRKKR